MPGPKKCEVGCTCGHHPQGMLAGNDPRRVKKDTRRSMDRRTREQTRRYALRAAHSMTLEDWEAMWTKQGGKCCYCEESFPTSGRQVHIDHDHACCPPKRSCALCRRGLACQNCNFVLGNAHDDPDRLVLIAENLRKIKLMTSVPT